MGANEVSAVGIGDLASAEKGTGARFNTGKPDFSLIPLTIMARAMRDANAHEMGRMATECLFELGLYQETRDLKYLMQAIYAFDGDGWEECAQVFSYGKIKYAAWNWAKGMPWSVPLACAARHLMAMIHGEALDPESGLAHLGHVFCNIVMLVQYAKTYREGDDFPPKDLL